MTDTPSNNSPIDAVLVAYLDGELDPAERAALEQQLGEDPDLRARLDHLARGTRDYAAFDVLLRNAPVARLQALLAGVEGRPGEAARRPASRWLIAIAAAVILFAAGGVLGFLLPRLVPGLAPPQEEALNWRTMVAYYVSLYTPETFAGIPDDPVAHAIQLAAIGEKVGLELDPQKVALPDLSLKGAIIFEFHGMPLAQIAYLSARDGPVAFCIIKNDRPDAAPQFEAREGKNMVHWQKGGRGYLIIGNTPRTELETLAATLESRIS